MRVTLSLVVAVSLGGAAVLLYSAPGGSAPVEFVSEQTRQSLDRQGVSLVDAQEYDKASIDPAAAIGVTGLADAPVREVKLMRLSTDRTAEPIDRLVWAVSFDPKGVEFPKAPDSKADTTADYMLAFVDVETGEFIFGIAKGGTDD